MKKNILIAFVAFIMACGSTDESGMSRDERLKVITELEQKAFADVDQFDTTMALALVNNYSKFVAENPEDELSPNFLFKAGDMAMGLGRPHRAIDLFQKIISDYPDHDKVSFAMFLTAFIYEDQLKDLDKAKVTYEAFIEAYPDHDMTDAAKFSLKNLGKSPEDLIREFEENQDTTQAQI